jgi:hypothetical protein
MRAKIILSSALAVALVAAAPTGTMESFLRFCAAPAFAADTDWKKVDLVFGRSAAVTGAVHRYGLPGRITRPWIASSQELLAMTGDASPSGRFGNYWASPKRLPPSR